MRFEYTHLNINQILGSVMKSYKKNISKNNFLIIFTIIVLILSVAIRCYWFSQKDGMNGDEVLSFVLCNYNAPTWDSQLIGNFTGAEVKTLTMINDTSFRDAFSDLWKMHITTRDAQHTNFYYSLLRISIVGLDSVDIKDINKRAFILNLFFFLIEFFFYNKLLSVYFKNDILSYCLGLLCFGLMAGGISNTLLNRDYQLQEMSYVILAYWIALIVIRLSNKEFVFTKRDFCITILSLTCALLTGYFAMFFVFFGGGFLLKKLYDSKLIVKGLKFFGSALWGSIVICFFLYRCYYMGFLGDGRIKKMILEDGVLIRLLNSLERYCWEINLYTLYMPVLLLLFIIAVFRYKHIKSVPWIVLPTFIYTIFIFIIAPFKVNRYIVAATPILLLLIPYFVKTISNVLVRKVIFCVISLIYILASLDQARINSLAQEKELKEILSENNITIVQSNERWQIATLFPYMNDYVKYNITNRIEPQKYRLNDIVAIDNKIEMDKKLISDFQLLYCQKYFDFYRVK